MTGLKLAVIALLFMLAGTIGIIYINSDFDNHKILDSKKKHYVIPEWVKQNAYWWSQGHISDAEWSFSIQYLFDKGIIKYEDCVGECA